MSAQTFDTCTSLAESKRQSAHAVAKATLIGGFLQRGLLIADQQYFLDVLTCCTTFNRTSPGAVEGLRYTTDQLGHPSEFVPTQLPTYITTEAGDQLITEAGAFIRVEADNVAE